MVPPLTDVRWADDGGLVVYSCASVTIGNNSLLPFRSPGAGVTAVTPP